MSEHTPASDAPDPSLSNTMNGLPPGSDPGTRSAAPPSDWKPDNADLLDQFDAFTDDQLAKVAELSARVPGLPMPPSYEYSLKTMRTMFLGKFLIARNWDVEAAFTMLKNSATFKLAHRYESEPVFPSVMPVRGYDIEALKAAHGTGDRPEGLKIDAYGHHIYPYIENSYHKWDKRGRPVLIERIGPIKGPEFVGRLTALVPPGYPHTDPVVAFHLHAVEVASAIIIHTNQTRPADQKVAQIVCIFDCDGLGMKHLWDPLIAALKRNSNTDKQYFPEGMHKAYVVNAPTIVTAFWAVVKLWLTADQIKKVVFLKPHETKKGLLEAFDEEHLPEMYGGKCKCEGGCVPPNSERKELPLPADATREFTVPNRKKTTVTADWLTVDKAGVKMGWQFHVTERNCNLRVRFKPTAGSGSTANGGDAMETTTGTATFSEPSVTSQPEEWQDLGKCSHQEGFITSSGPGCIEFELDNSYSMLRSKRVLLRACLPEVPEFNLCSGLDNRYGLEDDDAKLPTTSSGAAADE